MEFYPDDRQQPNAAGPGTARRRRKQLGGTFIEFALVIPFIAVAFFGTVSFGIVLGRYVQVVQVCRDIAHMYARGVDFTGAQAKAVAVQLAQGTGMTANGGNGVVILSRIRQIYDTDCAAAGYGSCPNAGQIVFTQRVVVGNASLRASAFGTPSSGILNPQGNINPSVYLQNTDSSVRTNGEMAALYTQAGQPGGLIQGDSPWVVEVFFTAPDISFLDFSYSANLKTSTSGGAYAKLIF